LSVISRQLSERVWGVPRRGLSGAFCLTADE
jgi:hypothetical protein